MSIKMCIAEVFRSFKFCWAIKKTAYVVEEFQVVKVEVSV